MEKAVPVAADQARSAVKTEAEVEALGK